MANRFVSWRDGGETDEMGLSRWLGSLFTGGPITSTNTAWKVVQRGAGANMSVDVSIGDGNIPKSTGTTFYCWNDLAINVVIATADPTNPRRDIVVAYVDLSVVSSASADNPNALVFAAVAGTPAGSPSDPSAGTIQSAIGASNPYKKIGRVAVGAGVTSITNSNCTDIRDATALQAPLAPKISVLSATTVGTFADHVVSMDATSGARTYTLPDATQLAGRQIMIYKKDSSANAVTINTTAAQTVGFGTSDTLVSQNECSTYQSDGTNWIVISRIRDGWGEMRAGASIGTTVSLQDFITMGAVTAPGYAQYIDVQYSVQYGGSTGSNTGYVSIFESVNGGGWSDMDTVFGTSGISAYMPGNSNQPTCAGAFVRSVTPGSTYNYKTQVDSSGGVGNALKGIGSFIRYRWR